MSLEFDFELDPKDEAAAIFMGSNHRKLVAAAIRAKKKHGITQQQIADKIGVNKSVISRALSGRNNLTERTLAEICWAIGVTPKLEIKEIDENLGNRSLAEIVPNSLNVVEKTVAKNVSSSPAQFSIKVPA